VQNEIVVSQNNVTTSNQQTPQTHTPTLRSSSTEAARKLKQQLHTTYQSTQYQKEIKPIRHALPIYAQRHELLQAIEVQYVRRIFIVFVRMSIFLLASFVFRQ